VLRSLVCPSAATESWGADPEGIEGVLADLGGEGDRLAHLEADLADLAAPRRLVSAAVERFGPLDGLVLNHARSQLGVLDELEAETLDLTWAVNERSSLVVVRAVAEQYRPGPDSGRVVLFTSGQHLGPAPSEIPYAAPKGALQQITRMLADARHHRQLRQSRTHRHRLGTLDQEAFIARHMPRGRWNTPAEAADVVTLLLAPEAATITGQIVDAEGGFRRFTPDAQSPSPPQVRDDPSPAPAGQVPDVMTGTMWPWSLYMAPVRVPAGCSTRWRPRGARTSTLATSRCSTEKRTRVPPRKSPSSGSWASPENHRSSTSVRARGQIAAAATGASVVAVDVSPLMLDV